MKLPNCKWTVLLPILLAVGCSDSHKSATSKKPMDRTGAPEATAKAMNVTTGLVHKSIPEMAPGDVIVAVNGVALTKESFDARVALAVQRLANQPGVNTQVQTQMRREIMRKVVPDFVSYQSLVQEAHRLGAKPSKESQAKVERAFAKIANDLGVTVNDLRTSQSPRDVAIRETLDSAPAVEALLQDKIYSKSELPDELATNTVAAIEKENTAAEEKNAEHKALLAKLRAQIMSGDDFGSLAEQYSQCQRSEKGKGGYWGSFARSDIENRDLCDAIFALNTNEVSQILEDEMGFHIVKMLRRNPVVMNEKQAVVEKETCELAHILLSREPLLINMPVPMMKKELVKQKRATLLNEYIAQLAQQMRIEYPHGTNLWARPSSAHERRPIPGVIGPRAKPAGTNAPSAGALQGESEKTL